MLHRTRTWAHLALILVVVLLSLSVVSAQDAKPETIGLRPDAPIYALHGPYWVGMREFAIEGENGQRSIPAKLWYPAMNSDIAQEAITYEFELKMQPVPSVTLEAFGQAFSDSEPDVSSAPYPLIVFSHGFSADAAMYANFIEHLASYGFVIIAPDHDEVMYLEGEMWKDIPKATIERPRDIVRAIDYAEELTAEGGMLEGLIDMSQVAVAGHSYGGYTALAAAGARYDTAGFHKRCDTDRVAGDPFIWLCDTLIPFEADMAKLAEVDAVPADLWSNWGDARVDAIIPMAGDAYMFDQRGLAEITIPVMALGGTADTSTPYYWGSYPTFEYISSQQKALVSFENAEHGVFVGSCQTMPWMIDMGFFGFCADAIWDKDRIHDLINHFTTAFLLDVLKGDKDAHAALAPDAASFIGIEYKAEGY